MVQPAPQPTYDPTSPEFVADPYPVYAALRDEDPVHRQSSRNYVVSRYDDVVATLRDWERFSSSPIGGGQMAGYRFLIGSDPPDHTTLRRLVNKPFHPRNIAAMEPRVREICEELVAGLLAAAADGAGVADVVRHLTYPLPVIVISEMLGIPPERKEDFKRWSDAMIGGLSPDFDRGRGATAMMEMFAFFNSVAEERRADPQGDLISLLVSDAEPLSNQEVLMFCLLLLVAGNETTTNLLSNLIAALFENPDALSTLRSEPSRIADAVEEGLRFDSPVQCLWRQATCDIEMAGTSIPAGSRVVVLYGSANRDERHFPEADRFDLDRFANHSGPPDHVAFGSGIHLCLGAALARLEARVAMETLLDRTSSLALGGEPRRLHNMLVRGMESLPVKATPA